MYHARGLTVIKNQLKTILLLTSLSALLLLLGNLFGGTSGLYAAFIMALCMNSIAFFFSDRIVLAMYKAQPMDPQQYHSIYTTVQELTERMNLPMPKLWVINSQMANAFATGRNPHNASIALTTSVIQHLDEYELRGVIAHELGHIKNRDILIATLAAVLATTISYMAHMAYHFSFFASMSNNRRKANPITLLVVAILTPMAASIIQLAISRSREYLADETGAYHSQDPLALASALEKLHRISTESFTKANDYRTSTASLFIVNPFTHKEFVTLFSTHPPVKNRIERLHRMNQKGF